MFKRNGKKILLLTLTLAMVFSLTACSGGGSKEPEISEDSVTWELAVETPEEEIVTITQVDQDTIGLVDLEATAKHKDGTEEKNKWTGMVLKDILEFADISDYSLVEVEAIDGFTVEYTPEIVNNDGTILAIKVDGESLDEDSGPIQSVVEGQGQNLWIRQVVKLTVSQ